MKNIAPENKRDFKGVWIPKEIFLHPELSAIEILVWTEINSLYSEDVGGCYATNEYLADFFQLKDRRLREIIYTLRNCGLIEDVSFDGRRRVIKAIMPQDVKNSAEQTGRKVPPRVAEKCQSTWQETASPSYIENTSKNTRREIAEPCSSATSDNIYKDSLTISLSPSPSKTKIEKPTLEPFGSHVKLTKEQYQDFCKLKPKSQIDELIEEINDYCAASRPKGYLDYAAAIRQWLKRKSRDAQSTPTSMKGPSITDRRTKNIDGSSMPSPADGRF